jgi:hypothetical protein
MVLSNAARQRRWRAKREAVARANSEVVERGLLRAAERCAGLSDAERAALADQLADAGMGHLRRAQALAALARRVRTSES